MKLDLSIREKLVISYVVLGFIAVTVLGLYSFMSARDAILDRSFEQLTSVREVKKARLTQFFNDRIREIELIAQSPNIQEAIIQNKSQIKIDTHIQKFLIKGKYYSSVVVAFDSVNYAYSVKFDTASIAVVYSNRLMGEIYKKIYSKICVSRETEFFDYCKWNNEYTLFVATPVIDKHDKVHAVLMLGIPLSAINNIMFEKNSFGGLGSSGESYLVGDDYLMRSSSRFRDKSTLKTYVRTEGAILAFKKQIGTKIINDYRGISVLSSYTNIAIPNLKWVILAEIDFKEVMIPVYRIRNDIVLMSGLIILFLSIFAFLISRRITTPLLKLRTVALEIAKGHYGKTIPIDSLDEVGELTDSFNIMSVQIKEQTKELRENEKRLHHFYQATTDGIVLHNRGKILLVNQAITTLTKYRTEELLQKELTDIINIKDIERIKKHPEKTYTFETDCIQKDGKKFPVEVIEKPIEYEGDVISALVVRNITERIEAHLKLEEERTKRLTSFIDGQEDERKRLSRDLHDGLGQSLIGIKMRLEMLRLVPDEKNGEILNMVNSFVNQTIKDVRRMSNNLMPSVLRDIGLKLAIQKLCEENEKNTGMIVTFEADTVTKISDDRVKSYLYRITQEAIHNAVKHSQATEMSIMMVQEPRKIRLIIEDNGIGFDEEKLTNRGNGLYSMQERVAILNGQITISSSPGKGVYIDVRLPLP